MKVTPRSPSDLNLMRLALRAKYDQWPNLQVMPAETKGMKLVEDVSARPGESGLFWGMAARRQTPCWPGMAWRGQNWLGKLWMQIRDGS